MSLDALPLPNSLANIMPPDAKRTVLAFGNETYGWPLTWHDFVWSFKHLTSGVPHIWLGKHGAEFEAVMMRGWRLAKDGSIVNPRLSLVGKRLSVLETYSGLGHNVRVSMALTEEALDITMRSSNLFTNGRQTYVVRPGSTVDSPVLVQNTPILTASERGQHRPVPMVETPLEVVNALYIFV